MVFQDFKDIIYLKYLENYKDFRLFDEQLVYNFQKFVLWVLCYRVGEVSLGRVYIQGFEQEVVLDLVGMLEVLKIRGVRDLFLFRRIFSYGVEQEEVFEKSSEVSIEVLGVVVFDFERLEKGELSRLEDVFKENILVIDNYGEKKFFCRNV